MRFLLRLALHPEHCLQTLWKYRKTLQWHRSVQIYSRDSPFVIVERATKNPAIGFISSHLGLVKRLWKYFNNIPHMLSYAPECTRLVRHAAHCSDFQTIGQYARNGAIVYNAEAHVNNNHRSEYVAGRRERLSDWLAGPWLRRSRSRNQGHGIVRRPARSAGHMPVSEWLAPVVETQQTSTRFLSLRPPLQYC